MHHYSVFFCITWPCWYRSTTPPSPTTTMCYIRWVSCQDMPYVFIYFFWTWQLYIFGYLLRKSCIIHVCTCLTKWEPPIGQSGWDGMTCHQNKGRERGGGNYTNTTTETVFYFWDMTFIVCTCLYLSQDESLLLANNDVIPWMPIKRGPPWSISS